MKTFRKALTAAAATGAATLGTAALDGRLTIAEALAAVGAALLAGAAVYRVPNDAGDPQQGVDAGSTLGQAGQ